MRIPEGPLIPPEDKDGCVLHEGITYDPRWKMVLLPEELPRSSSSVPAAREVVVAESVRIDLERPTTNYSAPVIVKLSIQLPENLGPSDECIVHIPALGGLHRVWITRVIAPGVQAKLRIEVYDDGNGGPTGDPPYTIMASIYTSGVVPGGIVNRRTSRTAPGRIASERPDPTRVIGSSMCEVVSDSKRSQSNLEMVRSFRVDDVGSDWLYLDYIEAGRNLYLQVEHDDGAVISDGTISIRAYSKNEGNEPYAAACNREISNRDLVHSLVLATRHSGYMFRTIWRIEVSPKQNPAQSTEREGLTLQLFRDRDPERFGENAENRGPLKERLSSAFLCLLPAGERTLPSSGEGAFARAASLRIGIEASDGILDEAKRALVARYILDAVAMWRWSCRQCRVENLLFVEIDGKLYWLRDAASWIREAGGNVKSDFVELRNARAPIPTYSEVDRNDPAVHTVCAVPNNEASQGLRAAQSVLNCQDVPTATVPTPLLLLSFKRRTTGCGADSNIIACEADYQLIEMNVLDYTFREFGAGPVIVPGGSKAVDLFHVLLHEVGHWIGLDHLDIGTSVMASDLSTSRCIDVATARLIGKPVPDQVRSNIPKSFHFRP